MRVRGGLLAVLVLTGTVLTSTPAPAASPDPTRPGPRQVTRVEYDAGPTVLAVQPRNGAPIAADLHGDLHVPAGRGPFPVVLLLHGRHGTCAYAGVESLGHPCPRTPVTTPVDSYRGYAYLARNLASHGYLVVSVDANGINTYDTADLDAGALARAELVSRTLDLLAAWSTRSGPGSVGTALVGKVDLRRLGLMGHSRGGEGVTRWLAYNRERTDGPRYTASAVFSLAPTDFADHAVVDRTPYAVLLPRCDGDVSDLQGADVFERSQYRTRGPLHQITVEGANHNWFNSVWTGDDSGFTTDAACGPRSDDSVRLEPQQQERVGLAWMGAFFRHYVGGERAFAAMLTGRAPGRTHCAPGIPMACGDLLDLSYDPAGARRVTVLAPTVTADGGHDGRVDASAGLSVSACDPGLRLPCPTQGGRRTPGRSKGGQLVLDWSRPSSLRIDGSWRARPGGDLVVRIGVNDEEPVHALGSRTPRLRLQLTDAAGRRATVRVTRAHGSPEPAPGSAVRNMLLSDVRVPLAAFAGVDVRALRSVRLLLDDPQGSLQLADVALQS